MTAGAEEEEIYELELLRSIRTDNPEAFNRVVRAYWKNLVGFAYDLVGSPDSAEDIAQEACIQLWKNRHGFEGRGSLRAYLMQSIRRLALNEFRNRRVRDRPDVVARVRAAHVEPITPEGELEATNLSAAIETALRNLPVRRREAFVLVRFHGLSYREAAEVMGVSTQTLANHVCAALRELREALSSYT
ncbi:MAG TPA: sigma-70 family RNA polymerase sigma factor [Gemmatimonadaceae bacterium]|nr:sigma-70 family RNA polymerase sigma factor [Gemmatimonadaceae bacterium]